MINGSKALVGAKRGSLDRAVRDAGPLLGGPTIKHAGSDVVIGPGAGGPASVLLVTYDPRERKIPVKAGENTGRTLHRNIVLDLREVGVWTGRALRVGPPAPKDAALRSAVLLQKGAGGPLLAAAKL